MTVFSHISGFIILNLLCILFNISQSYTWHYYDIANELSFFQIYPRHFTPTDIVVINVIVIIVVITTTKTTTNQTLCIFPLHRLKAFLSPSIGQPCFPSVMYFILLQQLQISIFINSNVITTSPHQKIWLLRARCSLTGTFINTPGPPLMARLTTRLTTYW